MTTLTTPVPLTGFASQILLDGPTPRQGNKTDNAHPPIHPTRYTNSLSVSLIIIIYTLYIYLTKGNYTL